MFFFALSAPLPKWDTQLRPCSGISDSSQEIKHLPRSCSWCRELPSQNTFNSLKLLLGKMKTNRTPETSYPMTDRPHGCTATAHFGVSEILLQHKSEVLDPHIQTGMVRQLRLGASFDNPLSRLLGDVPSSLVSAEANVQLQERHPLQRLRHVTDARQPAMYSIRQGGAEKLSKGRGLQV